jgi:hypothetical protein
MALDVKPAVRPAMQRACWGEWLEYYTYGQTLDRVRYAEQRIAQLGGSPTVASVVDGGPGPDPLQAPVPRTGLFTPPSDAGVSDATLPPPAPGITGATADASVADASPPSCSEQCATASSSCQQRCRTAACHKSCAARLSACVAKCEP